MLAGDEFCARLHTAQAKIEEQLSSFDEGHLDDSGESFPKPFMFLP
jgi:hypothetical protein